MKQYLMLSLAPIKLPCLTIETVAPEEMYHPFDSLDHLPDLCIPFAKRNTAELGVTYVRFLDPMPSNKHSTNQIIELAGRHLLEGIERQFGEVTLLSPTGYSNDFDTPGSLNKKVMDQYIGNQIAMLLYDPAVEQNTSIEYQRTTALRPTIQMAEKDGRKVPLFNFSIGLQKKLILQSNLVDPHVDLQKFVKTAGNVLEPIKGSMVVNGRENHFTLAQQYEPLQDSGAYWAHMRKQLSNAALAIGIKTAFSAAFGSLDLHVSKISITSVTGGEAVTG